MYAPSHLQTFNWVLEEVLLVQCKAETRAEIIEAFIMLAKCCKDIGNFQSLTAIVLALNHPFIRQLTTSWSAVSDNGWKTLEIIERFCLECKDTGVWEMRDAMNRVIDIPQAQRLIIPFWGLYLMEMMYAAEACSHIRELVYFDKFRKMADPAR